MPDELISDEKFLLNVVAKSVVGSSLKAEDRISESLLVQNVPDALISAEKCLFHVMVKSVVGPSLKDDDSGHEPVLTPFFGKGLPKSKSQSGVATLSVDLKINVMVSAESVGIDHSQAAPSRDEPFFCCD